VLRSGAFWLGAAVGAAVTWWLRRSREQLIAVAPHYVKPLTRRGRMGQGWPGGQGGGAYR